jgi:hypothetical protein
MTQAWIEVDQGRRPLDWAVAIGDPAEADYLTPNGRDVAARIIDDLEAFFGPDWLHRATHPAVGTTGPTMGPYFASLMNAPAFAAAVSLWARLQLLVELRVQGVSKLRDNLRANPVAEEFRHHVTLARLAAQAWHAGAKVVVEPVKPEGGPGDLLAVRGGIEAFIEARILWPDQGFRKYNKRVDEAHYHLRLLESRYDVHFSGDLPVDPNQAWKEAVTDAAARAVETGVSVDVTTNGATLAVVPGPGEVGIGTSGPLWEANQGHRLARALVQKALKTASTGAAWLWLEDSGAIWPLTTFARSSLREKVAAVEQAVDGLFATYFHVIGVVFTSGEMRFDGPRPDEREEGSDGVGFVQTLPTGLVRESVVVHRRLQVPGQYGLIKDVCAGERGWLDAALRRLGAPGGMQSLTTWPIGSGVETLPGPRHRSGLYLPR